MPITPMTPNMASELGKAVAAAQLEETIGRVAAGAVAQQILTARFPELRIVSWVERVADVSMESDNSVYTREQVDAHPTRCPVPAVADQMESAILTAKKSGDSLGGYVRCVVTGCPPGPGKPHLLQTRRGAGLSNAQPPGGKRL